MTFSKDWRLGLMAIVIAAGSTSAIGAEEPNDLVRFLAGEWENVSFEISDGKPVKASRHA